MLSFFLSFREGVGMEAGEARIDTKSLVTSLLIGAATASCAFRNKKRWRNDSFVSCSHTVFGYLGLLFGKHGWKEDNKSSFVAGHRSAVYQANIEHISSVQTQEPPVSMQKINFLLLSAFILDDEIWRFIICNSVGCSRFNSIQKFLECKSPAFFIKRELESKLKR